jgi:hypothetical protein
MDLAVYLWRFLKGTFKMWKNISINFFEGGAKNKNKLMRFAWDFLV